MQSWRAIGLGSSESREDSEVQEEMPRAQERPQENGRDGRSSFSAPTEGKIGLYTSQKKIPVGAQCVLTTRDTIHNSAVILSLISIR